MDSKFVKQTIDFLEESDLNFIFPELREVELSEESSNTTLKLCDYVYYNSNTLEQNFIISNLIIFALFDGYLDSKNNVLMGLTFKKKYNKLNNSNDIEIITKEVYRILKLVRNTIVHNATGAVFSSDIYKFSYTYPSNSTIFNLEITKSTLALLYSIIMIIVSKAYLRSAKDPRG